jgi:hypothetical protein
MLASIPEVGLAWFSLHHILLSLIAPWDQEIPENVFLCIGKKIIQISL